ncbi:MAG: CheR family methyltransferase, partial [Microvirgula sp.]
MTVSRFFIDFLNAEIGLDVDSIGIMHVERAIDERLRATRLPDAAAYQIRLQTDSAERQALIEAVVVGETWFFRDREAFHTAARLARQQFAGTPLRLLSLPCSTGEEPYSLAMALLDAGMPPDSFAIDAIDISAEAIAAAGRGIYGNNAFRGRQLDFRARHFTAVAGGQRLNDPVRARVRFRQGNLFDPALLAGEAPYDLVFCRNVLIYFDRDGQQRAISTLCARLAPRGLLFVGPAESGLLVRAQLRPAGIPLAFAFHPPTADEPAPRRSSPPRPLRSLRP